MADRNTARKDGQVIGLKIAASTSHDAGKMAAVNAAGYAVPADDAAGLKVAGITQEAVDNSTGANGDKRVEAIRGKAWLLDNDTANPVTQAHVMTDVYVKDDATVSSDGGTNSIVAGLCLGVETEGVLVFI